MKKLIFTNLLVMLSSMVGVRALAYDIVVKINDERYVYYNIINDGKELEVTYHMWGDHYSNIVDIPEEVTFNDITRKVTSIGDSAFARGQNLTISIPKSINRIGKMAFWKCDVKTVKIYDLEAWCNIELLDNPIIYAKKILLNGEEIKEELVIPGSIKKIANGAFSGFSSLISVTIADGVEIIGSGTFSGCSKLETVTIPNSVTSIGDSAFEGCSSLKSVTIPNGVSMIGDSSFRGCI